MKIKNQSAEEIVFTDAVTAIPWFCSIFIIVGIYLGYDAHTKHESLVFSLAFIVLGIGTFLISQNRIVRINKSSGKITIQTKSVIKNTITTVDIAQVEQIHLQLYPQYSNSNRNNTTNVSNVIMMSQLNLYLKNGSSIPLERATGKMQSIGTNLETSGQKGVTEGIQLSTFLNIPFQIIDSKNVFIPKQ